MTITSASGRRGRSASIWAEATREVIKGITDGGTILGTARFVKVVV